MRKLLCFKKSKEKSGKNTLHPARKAKKPANLLINRHTSIFAIKTEKNIESDRQNSASSYKARQGTSCYCSAFYYLSYLFFPLFYFTGISLSVYKGNGYILPKAYKIHRNY